jgi:regulator of sirC expression with transglutaminase-like and TPR domain
VSEAREARRALGELVSGELQAIDLPLAALLIAQEEYPDLEPLRYVARLDRLGAALRERLADESVPERQVAILNALLFGEEGFRGNTAHYYDPRNSYLNDVLDRRLGIPITLSVVYVAVGRCAGLPLVGVGLPAHFVVGFEAPTGLVVDPFNCGRVLSLDDCQELLRQAFGSSMTLESSHLAPTSPRHILARLITNLKVAYQRAGDLPRALRASEQLSLVLPTAAELRERGMLRYRLADLPGAVAELNQYLGFEPAAPDADAVRRQIALIEQLHERRN